MPNRTVEQCAAVVAAVPQGVHLIGFQTGVGAMDDVLVRIKRAVLAGRYLFSEKPSMELEAVGLGESEIAEAILNAVAIDKRLRSRSPRHPIVRRNSP